MKLHDIGEFGLIERISSGTVNNPEGLVAGIGDDAAVLKTPGDKNLLVTCDMLVEGVHFLPKRITPYQLGRKALAVNLSDIAAMGGIPRHALVSIALPIGLALEYVDELYRGLKDIAQKTGVNVVGGDTVRAPILIIDVALLGEADPTTVVFRGGARPGDLIMVTGNLGASAAGLNLLLRDDEASLATAGEANKIVIKAHLEPVPRLAESRVIAGIRSATAMIDISDGLASEVNHICRISCTGARIWADRLPILEATLRVAESIGKSPTSLALYGGEDYELLFTIHPNLAGDLKATVEKATGTPVTVVGEIMPPEFGICLVTDGRLEELQAKGYNHFGGA